MDGDFPIVVLAASEGGLDALARVLAPLPARFPAAVLALLHTDPRVPAETLPDILGSHTVLPVRAASEGAPITAGEVLTGPPGQHVLATVDGRIALIPAGQIPPYRPSADLLLTSLAVTAGERVITVVLSGRGNDGATGATAVHRFGGVVIATDPASATAISMPEATISRDTITSHVVKTDDVADLLCTLAGGPRPS